MCKTPTNYIDSPKRPYVFQLDSKIALMVLERSYSETWKRFVNVFSDRLTTKEKIRADMCECLHSDVIQLIKINDDQCLWDSVTGYRYFVTLHNSYKQILVVVVLKQGSCTRGLISRETR